jgi:O-antigen/teichoic acid export membrane protein
VAPALFGSLMHEVRFPVLVSLQHDSDRFRAAYLKSIRLSLAAVVPLSMALWFAGAELFNVLLGPAWQAAIVPYQVLLVAGLLRYLLPDLAYTLGRPGLELFLHVAWLAAFATLLVLVRPSNPAAVAMVVLLTTSCYWGVAHWTAGRVIGLQLLQLIRDCRPYLIAAAGCAVLAFAVLGLVPRGVWSAVLAALGAVMLYFLMLRVLSRDAFEELRQVLGHSLARHQTDRDMLVATTMAEH